MNRAWVFLWFAVGWSLVGALLCRAAILEEGQVTLSPSVSEVGTSRGDGSVRVTPPSTLAGKLLFIARGGSPVPTNGSVFVEGAAINISSDIVVGDRARGLLQVTDGGVVDALALILGAGTSAPSLSEATFLLDGANTRARLGRTIIVGDFGFGEATISNGALLQSATQTLGQPAAIGNRLGSVGYLVVDGSQTAWQHGGPIVVGGDGTGSFRITGGASVSSSGATLAASLEGRQQTLGSAVIDGAGSRWITTNLTLGGRGMGELRVTNGGLLDVTASQLVQTVLGKWAGSFGRLVISGPGSRWVDPRATIIGGAGAGELLIEGGAIVSNGGALLGQSSSTGSGLAVVRGELTRWQTGGLVIGVEGNGWLKIEDGATVAAGFTAPIGFSRVGTRGRLTLDHGSIAMGTFLPFENRGVIEGDGALSIGSLNNLKEGRIIVAPGERLQLSGVLNNNTGARLEITDGEFEAGVLLINNAGGAIVSNGGVLRVRGEALINRGAASFLGDDNQVIGATTNYGSILAAPNSDVIFQHRVDNIGTMKSSDNASITILGAFTGNGVTGRGDVFLEGQVQPGRSPGAMNFGGDVTLGDLSELQIEVAGAEYDQLAVDGALTLSGRLQLQALSQLHAETTLTIASAAELAGEFSSVPSLGADLGYGVRFNGITYDYLNKAVQVSLLPGLAGDFDFDGTVSGSDFLEWQRQLGAAADGGSTLAADGNGDGVVDGGDLAVWQGGFASGVGATGPSAVTVPEPSTAALLFVALLGLCRSVGGRRFRVSACLLGPRLRL